MFQTTPTPRRGVGRVAIGALTVVALALAACSDDDDDKTTTTIEGVEVESLGAEGARVQLPGAGEVGQTASGTTSITTEVGLSGAGLDNTVSVTVDLDQDSEIVEVTADGGYVSETTFTDAAVEAPAGAEVDMEALVGVSIRQAVDAGGVAGDAELANADDLTSDQRAAYDAIAGDLATTAIVYPDEPVGVGAQWRATIRLQRQGVEIPITYDYELTALDGDDYAIAISYDEDIDTEVSTDGERADVSGTVTGGGTVDASASNPLLVTTTLEQTMDMNISSGGQSIDMTMDVAVAAALTAG